MNHTEQNASRNVSAAAPPVAPAGRANRPDGQSPLPAAPDAKHLIKSMADRLREMGDCTQAEFVERSDFTRAEVGKHFADAVDLARQLSRRSV